MARVELPDFFAKRLAGTPLQGPVHLALERCSEFYGDPTRGLILFPEFTDHGVTHFQRVLYAADALLTPESRDLLTAQDTAVLTIAVLLHDAAMHLTPDGFLARSRTARPGCH